MKLNRIAIDHRFKEIEKVEKLYIDSFPEDERIPFKVLLDILSVQKIMDIYYDNDQLIGMTYVFTDDKIVYLSYICIEEEFRNIGYGSEILEILKNDYKDKCLVIDIEECEENDDIRDEKRRGRDFYLRHGFVSTGIFYNFYHVDYEILCCNGTVTQEEWHSFLSRQRGRITRTIRYYKKDS
ncbi:MAG: GNAT family N-acetyltransferase [Erysipelotrichaceae bacterium]|nr:GNAT family N-acetyltransferase [Erysipelotrichaceae bacterium]